MGKVLSKDWLGYGEVYLELEGFVIRTHDHVISTLNCKNCILNDSLALMRQSKNVLFPVVRLASSKKRKITLYS